MDIQKLTEIKENFISELKKGNENKQSSLAFIKHELPTASLVKDGELFQILVVGGSISRRALVKKKSKGIQTVSLSQKNQSPFKTREAFLEFIEQELEDNISVLSLNLAYPLSPIFNHDKLEGILLSGTKENAFEGLIGKNVCAEIEEYVWTKKKRKILVTAANDTVCLLLSGLTQLPWDKLACGVIGTGVNFALFLDKHLLVNLEAANFDKFPQSPEGTEIDKVSSLPGKALFEKETSGAYLYRHFNILLHKRGLPIITIDDTKELTILAQETHSPYSATAKDLLRYSSELIAVQIAAISEYVDRDLVFVIEGSLFWEGFEYKKHVEETLSKIHTGKTVEFKHVHSSPIVGAAQLVG